ncbi:MAG: hypothetical protein PVG19_03185 [Desulfobacterales bacterium]|jgi:hypothetical protein
MLKMKYIQAVLVASILALWVNACQTGPPKDCLALPAEASAYRRMQTRIYPTGDEDRLLKAGLGVLQDSGFTIEQSATPCGLIVATRRRDVRENGKILASAVLLLFTGIALPLDADQLVTASLATNPVDSESTTVRITFHQMVWSIHGDLKINENMRDPEVYQAFFAKLSKSIFLDAHEI